MHLEQIRCTDVHPDPHRVHAGAEDLDALADSIRRHGVLRPILVRDTPHGYLIVHGERRWRAARRIGLQTIPALIVSAFLEQAAPLPSATAWELAAADD
jgi:ParB family chromosome partitioning protein